MIKNIWESNLTQMTSYLFNKTIKIPIIAIVVRAVFHENNKYPQVFSDECLSNINRK